MIYIKRELGNEFSEPFKGIGEAMRYIEANTGNYESNEIIALIDFEERECQFVKLETRIVATYID